MSERSLLILGRGSIGRKHASNAASLGVKTVTVDPDPKSEADFKDAKAAFASRPAGFSHAVIATPPALHLSSLELLLSQGVANILVEKPLCPAEELTAARKLSKRLGSSRVFVGFNWRFNSAVRELRQAIESGELGDVQTAMLYAREWLPRYGGNVLLESGSHILDTARYLLGPLKAEGAYLGRHGLLGQTDESATVTLSNPAGAGVSVHVNFVNKDAYDYRILVQGSRSTREISPDRTEPMHLKELQDFLNGDTSTLASLDDGLENLALLARVFSLSPKPVRAPEKINAAS